MHEELSQTPSLQPTLSRSVNSSDPPQDTINVSSAPIASDPVKSPRDLPKPMSKPQALSSNAPSVGTPSARASTLSWQQRPSSRGSTEPKRRPTSLLASESAIAKPQRESSEPASAGSDSISRNQIAQSLGSRDPSWFKQTHERGLGSAAFRKNQVEDTSETAYTTGSLRLPGMLRESTAELESRRSPPPESVQSSAPSMEDSAVGSFPVGKGSGSGSIVSKSSMQSPLPMKASQRFEPPSSDTISTFSDDTSSVGRTLAMSPSQGRISPERIDRPTSPTKGLGGFVQSAMLKRSDSVNKRWSAQAAPGLSRGNSVASNLSGYGGPRYPLGGITPLTESRPISMSREGSPKSNSRPTSSHSNVTATPRLSENDRPGGSTSLVGSLSRPHPHEESATSGFRTSKSPTPPDEVAGLPASPSKRWSPTKSSWLENAINKPDSPITKTPATQQPAWMADLTRAKNKKGSIDMGKESNFKEVAIGGLVRSPPGAGYRPPTLGGLPPSFSTGAAKTPQNGTASNTAHKDVSPPTTSSKDSNLESSSKDQTPPDPPSNANNIETKKPKTPPTKKPKSSIANRSASKPDPRPKASPNAKSRPETPPKKDLNPAPKPRQISGEKRMKQEPEFKNVFGNLRRTQTKNYVAPDELKDNIMRGKAGLTQTGGPKKTERKDEFKESILQKKQGMVVPSASTTIRSASSISQGQSIPEAIAKRKGLTRSESVQSNGSREEEDQTSKPEALARLQHLRERSGSTVSERGLKEPAGGQKSPEQNGSSGSNFTASLAGMLQRGPSPMAPKPVGTTPRNVNDERLSTHTTEPEPSAAGPQLSHATKARARGPKRRLPTANKVESPSDTLQTKPDTPIRPPITGSKPQISPLDPSKSEPRPLSNTTLNNDKNRKPSQPLSPRKPSTTITSPEDSKKATSPISQSPVINASHKLSPPVKQKPNLSPKDDGKSQSLTNKPTPLPDTLAKQSGPQVLPPTSSEAVTEKMKDEPQDPDPPKPSVKGAAATWGQPSKPIQSSRARSPIKLPTRKDEEANLEKAGLKSPEQVDSTPKRSGEESPKSPPIPGKKPPSISARVASTKVPLSPDAFFAEIFDESPTAKQKFAIDTQIVLDTCSSKSSFAKIKTLRKQIWEITENGKSVPVNPHQDHILFDQSIYLCTHVFGSQSGQRTTEVYLWCGDGAPASAIEDAQLFAKKSAKDNGGKLVILKQGKETANFFQALGGIAITRRGSSSVAEANTDPGSSYVLCGRQHVSQIAFDEVDYSPASLCKAFPHIVSTNSGKLYLWKGSGSSADELGCARLIGMDLGLTGEIEEIDEGREPDAFWKGFPVDTQNSIQDQRSNTQYWHLKSSCENYITRLFRVHFEAQRPKSASGFIQGAMQWGRRGSAPTVDPDTPKPALIKEVLPFAQSDIVGDGVFVLDSFFEVFV